MMSPIVHPLGRSPEMVAPCLLSLFAMPSFPLTGNISQGDLVSNTEAQSFLRACKPELDDFPHLVAALGAHLAPTFREVKINAIRRAEEVSQSMRCKHANFLWLSVYLPETDLCELHDGTVAIVRSCCLWLFRTLFFYCLLLRLELKRYSYQCRRYIWLATDVGVATTDETMFNAQVTVLPQARGADSFHGRADAFEATFERSYLAFQLRCRGVQALRQSLLEGDSCPDPDADVSDAAADSPKSGYGSQTASDERSSEGRAETYLLRTLGAQLAELTTARECEKLVRHRLDPLRVWTSPLWTNHFRIARRIFCRRSTRVDECWDTPSGLSV